MPCLFVTCAKLWKGVIGRCGKMCEITIESMRGGNKLHLNSMHILGLRLGQKVGLYASNSNSICKGWCGEILLRDSTKWLAIKICINLENLQQKVERKQQS
jgi:hypothetical protein